MTVKVVYNVGFGGFGLSDAAMKRLVELSADVPSTDPSDDNDHRVPWIARHDPRLVQVVEELGRWPSHEKSDRDEEVSDLDRSCDGLGIKELRGDRYMIDAYDGKEKVVEPDDLKWIVVESDR